MSVRPGVALGLVGLPPTTASAAFLAVLVPRHQRDGVGWNPRGNRHRGKGSTSPRRDPDHGREPWTSDGSTAGTTLVKDIKPEAGGSGAHAFTFVDGTIFFVAADGSHGAELVDDRRHARGDHMVEDLEPERRAPRLRGLVGVGETLFFGATISVPDRDTGHSSVATAPPLAPSR